MNRAQRRAAMRQSQNFTQKSTPSPNPEPDHDAEPVQPPISEAQLNANRANAQHSTGPKSETGRATSSQNHTIHGLARHNGNFSLLTSEDPAAFEALKTGLTNAHQPTDEAESDLVNQMAESRWLAQRAQNLQTSCMDPHTGHITDTKMFDRYLRYETKHSRDFDKAFEQLLKRRAERRKVENGFEAQKRHEEAARRQNAREERQKQHHKWDILKKDALFWQQLILNIQNYRQAAHENPEFVAQFNADLQKHGFPPVDPQAASY